MQSFGLLMYRMKVGMLERGLATEFFHSADSALGESTKEKGLEREG